MFSIKEEKKTIPSRRVIYTYSGVSQKSRQNPPFPASWARAAKLVESEELGDPEGKKREIRGDEEGRHHDQIEGDHSLGDFLQGDLGQIGCNSEVDCCRRRYLPDGQVDGHHYPN